MPDTIEISELDLNDDFGGGWDKPKPSKFSNLGIGMELLMNDKVKETSKTTSEFDLEDLNNLENELNGLVDEIPDNGYKSKSDMFGGNGSFDDKHSVKFNDQPTVGQSTADYRPET